MQSPESSDAESSQVTVPKEFFYVPLCEENEKDLAALSLRGCAVAELCDDQNDLSNNLSSTRSLANNSLFEAHAIDVCVKSSRDSYYVANVLAGAKNQVTGHGSALRENVGGCPRIENQVYRENRSAFDVNMSFNANKRKRDTEEELVYDYEKSPLSQIESPPLQLEASSKRHRAEIETAGLACDMQTVVADKINFVQEADIAANALRSGYLKSVISYLHLRLGEHAESVQHSSAEISRNEAKYVTLTVIDEQQRRQIGRGILHFPLQDVHLFHKKLKQLFKSDASGDRVLSFALPMQKNRRCMFHLQFDLDRLKPSKKKTHYMYDESLPPIDSDIFMMCDVGQAPWQSEILYKHNQLKEFVIAWKKFFLRALFNVDGDDKSERFEECEKLVESGMTVTRPLETHGGVHVQLRGICVSYELHREIEKYATEALKELHDKFYLVLDLPECHFVPYTHKSCSKEKVYKNPLIKAKKHGVFPVCNDQCNCLEITKIYKHTEKSSDTARSKRNRSEIHATQRPNSASQTAIATNANTFYAPRSPTLNDFTNSGFNESKQHTCDTSSEGAPGNVQHNSTENENKSGDLETLSEKWFCINGIIERHFGNNEPAKFLWNCCRVSLFDSMRAQIRQAEGEVCDERGKNDCRVVSSNIRDDDIEVDGYMIRINKTNVKLFRYTVDHLCLTICAVGHILWKRDAKAKVIASSELEFLQHLISAVCKGTDEGGFVANALKRVAAKYLKIIHRTMTEKTCNLTETLFTLLHLCVWCGHDYQENSLLTVSDEMLLASPLMTPLFEHRVDFMKHEQIDRSYFFSSGSDSSEEETDDEWNCVASDDERSERNSVLSAKRQRKRPAKGNRKKTQSSKQKARQKQKRNRLKRMTITEKIALAQREYRISHHMYANFIFALAFPKDNLMYWSCHSLPFWMTIKRDEYKANVVEDARQLMKPKKYLRTTNNITFVIEHTWNSKTSLLQRPFEYGFLICSSKRIYFVDDGSEMLNLPFFRTSPVFATGISEEVFQYASSQHQQVLAFASDLLDVNEKLQAHNKNYYISWPRGEFCEEMDEVSDVSEREQALFLSKIVGYESENAETSTPSEDSANKSTTTIEVANEHDNASRPKRVVCECENASLKELQEQAKHLLTKQSLYDDLPLEIRQGIVALLELFKDRKRLGYVGFLFSEVVMQCSRKKVIVCHSSRKNHGKSNFSKVLYNVFGESGVPISFTALCADQEGDAKNPALVEAAGKQLAIVDEIPPSESLGRNKKSYMSSHKMKMLTGNVTTNGWRRLNENCTWLHFNCALAIFSNHLPAFAHSSSAERARLHFVTFPRVFAETAMHCLNEKNDNMSVALATLIVAMYYGKDQAKATFNFSNIGDTIHQSDGPDFDACIPFYHPACDAVSKFVEQHKFEMTAFLDWSKVRDAFESYFSRTQYARNVLGDSLTLLKAVYDQDFNVDFMKKLSLKL